jgi:hypothetical protein
LHLACRAQRRVAAGVSSPSCRISTDRVGTPQASPPKGGYAHGEVPCECGRRCYSGRHSGPDYAFYERLNRFAPEGIAIPVRGGKPGYH